MPLSIVVAVLAAAFFHAIWNAILKNQPEHFSGLFAHLCAVSIISLAAVIYLGLPPREVWGWLAAGQALHFCYHCLLIATYRRGDMSLVYPILRGAAPPLAAIFGFFLLGDVMSLSAITGILIISAGVIFMSRGASGNRRALFFALATAATIASYSVIDAQGARLSGDTVQYVFWLLLFDSLFFIPLIFFGERRKKLSLLSAKCWFAGAIGGILSITAYSLVLHAYTIAPVGAVASLRETSVLFGALIGMFLLKEPKSPTRFIGAAIILAGVVMIVL